MNPVTLDSKMPTTPRWLQTDGREFLCGWGAAVINICITFPINKVIFRQMLHNVGVTSAVQQISGEGLVYLYRGVLPPLFQKSISLSIMFGIYDSCCRPLLQSELMAPVLAKATAAIIAGSVEAVLVPFERVQTLMQDRNYHNRFTNTTDALRALGRGYSVREYYRGLVPILWRNGPSNACFFLIRDELKERLPEPKSLVGKAVNQFAVGAVIGAFCSTVFYPCNVLKVHMQSQLGGPFQSMTAATLQIYRERGFLQFYRGIHMNYTRSFISWGIINVAYEAFKHLLYEKREH